MKPQSRCQNRGPFQTTIRKTFLQTLCLLMLALIALPALAAKPERFDDTDGSLRIIGKGNQLCPLKRTDVDAEISGFLARVTVTQEFVNPSQENIEAVYTFPLPQNSAVDDMTMTVGGRTIRALIKPRDEAQKLYQQARDRGNTAALLDQERPNIFTQSVTNIAPGATVKVKISYIETLKYEAGVYEFVYPMVVGPRYMPGQAVGKQGGGWSPDTDRVPDASRISPPVAGVHFGQKESRAGHDIDVRVRLTAGMPIQQILSPTHEVDMQRGAETTIVELKDKATIPNKDFVLRYDLGGKDIGDALLTHSNPKGGGYFTFILQPPDRVRDEDATARELIFVLDTSGSMSGFPLETAKKVMRKAIQNLRAGDTFNLITFAGDTKILFPQPVVASAANVQQAIAFMEGQRGGGGTEMMKAIRAALGEDASAGERGETDIRIVCFMTDAYVGNDMEIIAAIQKHPEARVFSFGIGSSVNRFLLDKMAEAGRGEVEYVLDGNRADEAAARFYERVHTPVLTDVSLQWNGLPVSEVFPAKPLDLFAAKPVIITGRYDRAAKGKLILRGNRAGKPFSREITVDFPAGERDNQALAQLWARQKIDQIMSRDWQGIQSGSPQADVQKQITDLGMEYRLMTQFTSFVAVEETTVVQGGKPRIVQVPVEIPHGVSPEGVFGESEVHAVNTFAAAPAARNGSAAKIGRGMGAGSGNRIGLAQTTGVLANDAVVVGARTGKIERKDGSKAPPPPPATKLHASLMPLYKCANEPQIAIYPPPCTLPADGKAKIEVWFKGDKKAVLDALKKLGFILREDKKAGQLTGDLSLTALDKVIAMHAVKLVALAK